MQPVDPLDLWKTPPFEPYVDRSEGFFHGRGVSDDKGGLLQPIHVRPPCFLETARLGEVLCAHVQILVLMQAVDAFLKGSKALPVNVKVPIAYTAGVAPL